jgi:hypothetical protein
LRIKSLFQKETVAAIILDAIDQALDDGRVFDACRERNKRGMALAEQKPRKR